MIISITKPLARAWKRMINDLFRPFNISKWFVVGFTVFLAELTEGPHHIGYNGFDELDKWDFHDILDIPDIAWEWIMTHTVWAILIGIGIVLLIAFIILLTWLSSRGAFMFLDNVVHNRALVTKPWRQFKKAGNSVFLWRLIFGMIIFFLVILLILLVLHIVGLFLADIYLAIPIFLIGILSILTFSTIVLLCYISMFLNNFVIPIMYIKDLKVLKGWRLFLQLLKKFPGNFIVYGIFLFCLHIGVIILVVIAGLLTCCIGFIILVIPYINSVLLLPISYTFRAYSLEFLEQFGPEYEIFPKSMEEKEEQKK